MCTIIRRAVNVGSRVHIWGWTVIGKAKGRGMWMSLSIFPSQKNSVVDVPMQSLCSHWSHSSYAIVYITWPNSPVIVKATWPSSINASWHLAHWISFRRWQNVLHQPCLYTSISFLKIWLLINFICCTNHILYVSPYFSTFLYKITLLLL